MPENGLTNRSIVLLTLASALLASCAVWQRSEIDRVFGPPVPRDQATAKLSAADQRRWRAWAYWYLTRQVKPALPGDAKQGIIEPAFEAIDKGLENHGISGEAAIWRSVLEKHS